MAMTKKDYILLAAALKSSKPEGRTAYHEEQWKADLTALSHALQSDNERFNLERFLSACGL